MLSLLLCLLYSIILFCDAFLYDPLSASILPHISIKQAPSGNRQITFAPTNDFSISPTIYELTCNNTENIIEFYDTKNDIAIVAITKDDYQGIMCIYLSIT